MIPRELGARELVVHPGVEALLRALAREGAGDASAAPPGLAPAGRAFVLEREGPGTALLAAAAVRAVGKEERLELIYAAPGAERAVRWRALFDWVELQLARPQAQPVAVVDLAAWRDALAPGLAHELANRRFTRLDHDLLDHPLRDLAAPPPLPPDLRAEPVPNARLQDLAVLMLQCREPGAPRWDFPFCWQSITENQARGAVGFPDGFGQMALPAGTEGAAGPIAGFVLASPRGLVSHVYVHPAHRGKGLAAALLGRVLAALGEGGHDRASIVVNAENAGARRVYERSGFAFARRLQAFFRVRTAAGEAG